MSRFPYMRLWCADYLADTTHLTNEQSGAYLHLLMGMWLRGGSLVNDEGTLRLVSRSGKRWGHVRKAVLPFFYIDGETVRSRRLDAELASTENIKKNRGSVDPNQATDPAKIPIVSTRARVLASNAEPITKSDRFTEGGWVRETEANGRAP